MNHKELFRIKTQDIVKWDLPSEADLFENTFHNRSTTIQRWDASTSDSSSASPFSKFELYWDKINQILSGIPCAIQDKYRYYWFVKRIIPNDLTYEFFKDNQEWHYFSNRNTPIPLRWKNSDGDYYTPLVKRKSKLDDHFESLCPYCHVEGKMGFNSNRFFFNDDLFLSYQYHLWEKHWISIKYSAEASPFVYHKSESGHKISCIKCSHTFSGTKRLDLEEYRQHVEFCKINHSFGDEKVKIKALIKFSELNELIVYDQFSAFDASQDSIFHEEAVTKVLTEIKAHKKQQIARKKEVLLATVAERKLKRQSLLQNK